MIQNIDYNSFFRKIFLWMFLGLLITFSTSVLLSTIAIDLFVQLLLIPYAFVILLILQIVLVLVITFLFKKLPTPLLAFLFLFYSFFTGITLTALFMVFELSSILFIFALTAGLFALLALIGYTTKTDLTKIGVILFVGLIGVILASVINIFLQNSLFDIIISAITVIVFMGLIAYDMQKLKKICENQTDKESQNKIAIIGALNLYLDFINLFINLLKLFGERK